MQSYNLIIEFLAMLFQTVFVGVLLMFIGSFVVTAIELAKAEKWYDERYDEDIFN